MALLDRESHVVNTVETDNGTRTRQPVSGGKEGGNGPGQVQAMKENRVRWFSHNGSTTRATPPRQAGAMGSGLSRWPADRAGQQRRREVRVLVPGR